MVYLLGPCRDKGEDYEVLSNWCLTVSISETAALIFHIQIIDSRLCVLDPIQI